MLKKSLWEVTDDLRRLVGESERLRKNPVYYQLRKNHERNNYKKRNGSQSIPA